MRGVLVTAACAGFVSLAGCGGGGGGDSGSSVSSNPVVYVGSSSAAVITATNAGALAANLTGNGSAVSSGLSVAGNAQFPDAGQAEVGRRLNRVVRRGVVLPRNEGGRLAMAIPVDETQPCDSGSTRVSGTLADDGTGTLTVTFNSCRVGDDTLSGSATMRVDAINVGLGMITDYTLGFSRLTIRGPGLSADTGGSQRSQIGLATNTETITENAVVLDNLTGRMTKSENVVLVDIYTNILSPSSYLETVTGRIYDSVHGYVDITTLVQLSFGTLTQDFPDSGLIELAGENGARIRATGLSTSLLVLVLDLDANGTFEVSATLGWADLSGPVGMNLADTDGDRIHDSWEIAKGLNPTDPGDAALDTDGDGANNLSEYLAGSDHTSAASVPPTVGLSVTAPIPAGSVTVGSTVTYSLTVNNSSSTAATNVVVTNTLPGSVNLIQASASQGFCAGTAPVVCALGTIPAFSWVSITLVVVTSVEGVITDTATVTTNSFDPNTGDNTATITTTVGQPVAGLNDLIAAAPDGGVVNVGPGIYVGGLTFGGRNVVLQSTAGPASTIIHGGGVTAVRIGPGGSIRGFTITGSPGLAVQVTGNGSLISGNVFTGSAVVIEGNNVSPIIERNIFRNNGCSNAPNLGLIQPFNNSSPVIVNNIFENNACFAINLVLPSGNTPQILNNTFVGNFGAIKVDRRVTQVTQVYRNNLIVQNGTGLQIDVAQGTTDADNPVWQNNLLWANTVSYEGTVSQTLLNGNIEAAPAFVDQAGGNYRLLDGSAAVDAGSATAAPATDFDGTARPQGAGFDIGAFEKIP